MTCIIGLVDKDRIYMGGDSAGSNGYGIRTTADPKVFINRNFIFGFTSSFRMGQLLHYNFTPPERVLGRPLYQYMITDFINSVREVFKDSGFITTDHGQELGGTFLVGTEGRLFRIEDSLQVLEMSIGYDACGCGEDYALGSLYSTNNIEEYKMEPQHRIITALNAAQEFSAGVRAPFNILHLLTKS